MHRQVCAKPDRMLDLPLIGVAAAFDCHPRCPQVQQAEYKHSVPENVRLEAVDPHTVQMKWDPPAQPLGDIIGYIIGWYLDNRWQGEIHVSSTQSYNFTDLLPEQSLSAHVRVLTQKGLLLKHKYTSNFSKVLSVTTPRSRGSSVDPEDARASNLPSSPDIRRRITATLSPLNTQYSTIQPIPIDTWTISLL
ncbi:Oncosphere antigen A [Taenia solium]|eukprot:TsM_000408700 transcript=TsM_000408700 gene=TsM_000408700